MRYVVWKSLDKPSSLFGIKGSYVYLALAAIGVDVGVSVLVGMLTNSLVGTIVFIVLGAAVYFGTLAIQSSFSERERTKWFCAHRLPDFIDVSPRPMREYCVVEFDGEHGERKKREDGR